MSNMSESTLMDYLNKCQYLQRVSQRCNFVIDYNKTHHGFQVTLENEITAHSWLFDFADYYTGRDAGNIHQYFKRFFFSTERTTDENSEALKSFLSLYSKCEYGNSTESDYETDLRNILKIRK